MTDTTSDTAAPPKQVQILVQDALNRLNRKDLPGAEAALEETLRLAPEEPDALQLLGLIRRAQGRLEECETLYRRSLELRPEQSHVWRNLGLLLESQQRLEEARTALEEAVRLKPNFADAHLDLGKVQQQLLDFTAAEKSYRTVLRLQPNYALAKQCLSGLLNDAGRPKEAEIVIRQALSTGLRDPRQIAALHQNMGVTAKMQNRYAEALQWFDSAQRLVPEIPLVDLNRAATLQTMGRLDEAVESYRRAIARNPLDMSAHRDLNRLLYRLRRDEEFLTSFDDAAMFFPDFVDPVLAKANFLFHAAQYERAIETFRAAEMIAPENPYVHDGLALSLASLGRFDEAVSEHEKAAKYGADNGLVWTNFADTLLRMHDAKKALDMAQKGVDITQEDQRVLAVWSLALRANGDARDERLSDYENLVQVFDLSPPQGYDDMAAFNRDLNAYLDTLHRDSREPVDQTLRSGTQTPGDLFGRGHAPVELLRTRVDEAVNAYIASMKDDPDHPLFRRRAPGFKYSGSWSARLADCGFHTNHIHMMGWISSAYYVALPEAVDDAAKKEGWIKFGEPNFEAPIKDPVRRVIQPRVGRLVLFPSYMWHGTVPFHSANTRTTIAFDAVPR